MNYQKCNQYSVYSYLLCTPEGVPFYAGAGTGPRIRGANRNKWVEHTRRKIKRKGRQVLRIIFEHPTRKLASEHEKQLVRQYGRRDVGTGILINFTDGGDGGLGRVKGPEERKKLSKPRKKWLIDDPRRKALSERMLGNKYLEGKTPSSETREKISRAGKGRKTNWSVEHRQMLSNRMTQLNQQNPPRKG